MRLLPVIVWAFGLVSLLWFSASFGLLAQSLFGQPARSPAHALYGYAVAAVQIATVTGWAWALFRSTQRRSALNGWTEAMCGATAAAQAAIIGATMALIGGQIPGGRANGLIGHAFVAVLLMAWVRRARHARAKASAGVVTQA